MSVNAPLAFDASVKQLVQLLSGRTLVLIPQTVRADSSAMLRYLAQHAIDVLDCTPSQLAMLFDTGFGKRHAYNPLAVFVGGEAISGALRQRMLATSEVAFYNVYGPTECTVDATCDPIRGTDATLSIGRPISNTQIYILDNLRQPVPIGVTGEIYIGGAGVARGYLNKPELTAERFIANPFSADPTARMYKTGDLGRFRVDGNIEFLGRNDHQVKIRGFRIELGEIEAQLTRHSQIKEAVVIAREDTPGDKRLIAYLTHRAAVAPSVDSLRSHLKLTLPDYMIPSAFVMLDALPLTPNGKLDRKALPSPELSAFASRQYEAPQGEIEETLASIWQALLHIERVGRHDNFFDLGGHSLLTLHIVNRLEQSGKTVSVGNLFKYPTIASLATHIASEKEETIDNAAILIRSGTNPITSPLFLCHDGTGLLLYAHMLAPLLEDGMTVYGLPAAPLTETNLDTIEEMAQRLVRMIREVQSKGPYRLAGWSFGGLLAYEIATQLLDQGEPVEFLGMFDTHYNSASKHSAEYAQDAESQLLAHLVEIPSGEQPRFLERQLTYYEALVHYRARPIATHLHLFTAKSVEARAALEKHLGWGHVVPTHQISILPVPGNHFSMMKPPNIEPLAEMLSELLCEVTA